MEGVKVGFAWRLYNFWQANLYKATVIGVQRDLTKRAECEIRDATGSRKCPRRR